MASLLAGCVLLMSHSASPQQLPDRSPVLLSADEITYDRELGIVVAHGHVEVSQNDRILLADSITYNERAKTVIASGNLALVEPTGEVLFSDYAELTDDLREGVIKNVGLLLTDRSRAAAASAQRIGGNRTVLNRAVFSPCALCPEDPTEPPLWQLKAVRVTHDQETHTIEYEDAWMEILGIPVAYTPYLSHPDPTVKRKSGFLPPRLGYSSELGAFAQVPYFWVIGPDKDFTFSPIFTSTDIAEFAKKEEDNSDEAHRGTGVVLLGEYRQRVESGELRLEASGTITDRKTEQNGEEVVDQDVFRGHVDAEGRFDIDRNWRWGFDVERATDKRYLRLYDLSNAADLTSRAFTEGFFGRSYADAAAYSFQGLRDDDENDENEIISPVLQYSFVGQPNDWGGYPTFDANGLVLSRLEGRDSRRLSLRMGWTLPYTSPIGAVYTLDVSARGDAYWVDQVDPDSNDVDPGGDTFSGFKGRFFPRAYGEIRYPLTRRRETFSQIVEPVVALTLAPNVGNSGKIPNEDSLGFEFDYTDLFDPDRFPGLDRVDTGSRLDYGVEWSFFTRNPEFQGSIALGQSLRFTGDSAFPQGSGLEDSLSDVVGQLDLSPADFLDLIYRFQFDTDRSNMRRQELSVNVGVPALNLTGTYVSLEDEGLDVGFEEREEIGGILRSQFADHWSAYLGARHDIDADRTLYYAGGITYEDECFGLTLAARRKTFRDEEIDPETTVGLIFSFKYLGSLALPGGGGLSFGGSSDDRD